MSKSAKKINKLGIAMGIARAIGKGIHMTIIILSGIAYGITRLMRIFKI